MLSCHAKNGVGPSLCGHFVKVVIAISAEIGTLKTALMQHQEHNRLRRLSAFCSTVDMICAAVAIAT